jgi:hypothetical protein
MSVAQWKTTEVTSRSGWRSRVTRVKHISIIKADHSTDEQRCKF